MVVTGETQESIYTKFTTLYLTQPNFPSWPIAPSFCLQEHNAITDQNLGTFRFDILLTD